VALTAPLADSPSIDATETFSSVLPNKQDGFMTIFLNLRLHMLNT
jgi:hypothetical protein